LPELRIFVDDLEPEQVVDLLEGQDLHVVRRDSDVPQVLGFGRHRPPL
jgi:hypothetical protein